MKKYCYSYTDAQCFYVAAADEREAAIEEAAAAACKEAEAGEENVTVFVGECVGIRAMLSDPRTLTAVGERVCEQIRERFHSAVQHNDRIVVLSQIDCQDLGRMIVEFIDSRRGFEGFSIANTRVFSAQC